MKRSELNQIIDKGIEFVEQMHFKLPMFAYWSLEDWKTKGPEFDEIKDNMLGWDVTDFGSGDFHSVGLLLFTLRNGNFNDPKYVKPYCERILIQEEGQILPSHTHYRKMEDIINRGGGNVMIELYGMNEDGTYSDQPTTVTMDGQKVTVEPGGVVRLSPGQSITLVPGQYHKFWGEEGTGMTLLGEVSTVGDDRVDNRFYTATGRLPDVIEDEPPTHLLFGDYPNIDKLSGK
ncbi:MAG TPA: D-lyxose/D-mannose family sugar isomerase [Aggregatilinea sp.]|jgi:D-lyxose ketol-isomerase|uniref:D-lyxose/D-mannose family sugar isomerase n=1 Tax=Aggregatilinea sp. TaxID=2806333 RepID=UPI002BAC60EC|nr:D-lyxose/D-mannose family sugar isomerase [Aggregatilinea sp.]HML24789.1 D-lyxose/D-mannose family sugar isomerase [Aggregatilinea sp.]